MSITFASLKALPIAAMLALAIPAAQAQSTDDHHADAPAQAPGMGAMMQMMQMMQGSQMMQMAQMMQMMQAMQIMQSGQNGMPGVGMPGVGMPGVGMPGVGMPGAGMGMQGGMGAPYGMGAPRVADVETLIAGYKSALGITDAQLPQWNVFADALRAGGKQIQQARVVPSNGVNLASAPTQLEQRAALLNAELSAIKQSQAAASALYAVLSDAQKRTADLLMADHLSRM